jgi:endonuclease YncB( thermonuclease family)
MTALVLILLATLCAEPALVERVVDGDTAVVRLDGQVIKVRLIGVDAPAAAVRRAFHLAGFTAGGFHRPSRASSSGQ